MSESLSRAHARLHYFKEGVTVASDSLLLAEGRLDTLIDSEGLQTLDEYKRDLRHIRDLVIRARCFVSEAVR